MIRQYIPPFITTYFIYIATQVPYSHGALMHVVENIGASHNFIIFSIIFLTSHF